MRYTTIIAISLTLLLGAFGCGGDEQDLTKENSSVVLSDSEQAALAEELASIERYFQLPIEKRMEKSGELLIRYLDLKDKDPEGSLKTLKSAFYIIAKGEHPLMEEWLEIVPRVVGVDEGLLTDLQRLNEIELEIARHNNENREYIHELEETGEELQAAINDLKAQGLDPKTFKVPLKVELDE
ncbi:MAG: hypothetical protein OXN25_13975 [Candidatus Poribacteria bacterium]|nr:hypothetical protein [Candidatus Poribacteria bacterium]